MTQIDLGNGSDKTERKKTTTTAITATAYPQIAEMTQIDLENDNDKTEKETTTTATTAMAYPQIAQIG